MHTTARVNHPDNVEIEMTITMSLKDWRLLMDQLKPFKDGAAQYPACDVIDQIKSIIWKVSKDYYPSAPTENTAS